MLDPDEEDAVPEGAEAADVTLAVDEAMAELVAFGATPTTDEARLVAVAGDALLTVEVLMLALPEAPPFAKAPADDDAAAELAIDEATADELAIDEAAVDELPPCAPIPVYIPESPDPLPEPLPDEPLPGEVVALDEAEAEAPAKLVADDAEPAAEPFGAEEPLLLPLLALLDVPPMGKQFEPLGLAYLGDVPGFETFGPGSG